MISCSGGESPAGAGQNSKVLGDGLRFWGAGRRWERGQQGMAEISHSAGVARALDIQKEDVEIRHPPSRHVAQRRCSPCFNLFQSIVLVHKSCIIDLPVALLRVTTAP